VEVKKYFVYFALAALIICWGIYLHQTRPEPPIVTKSTTVTTTAQVTSAQFITLQTHAYFTKLNKEPSKDFMARISGIAASMLATYEKVTIEYFINETGDEQAIVTGEKKIGK